MVIYGVPECPKGTKLCDCITSDLEEVTSVVRNLDASIKPESVCKCHCLVKFVPDSCSRPILVKLSRSKDVLSILSKRGSLRTPHIIKPGQARSTVNRIGWSRNSQLILIILILLISNIINY